MALIAKVTIDATVASVMASMNLADAKTNESRGDSALALNMMFKLHYATRVVIDNTAGFKVAEATAEQINAHNVARTNNGGTDQGLPKGTVKTYPAFRATFARTIELLNAMDNEVAGAEAQYVFASSLQRKPTIAGVVERCKVFAATIPTEITDVNVGTILAMATAYKVCNVVREPVSVLTSKRIELEEVNSTRRANGDQEIRASREKVVHLALVTDTVAIATATPVISEADVAGA